MLASFGLLVSPLVAPALPTNEERLLSPLQTPDAELGTAVAVSGTTAAVGAPGAEFGTGDPGAVFVFVHDGTGWVEQAQLSPSCRFQAGCSPGSVDSGHRGLATQAAMWTSLVVETQVRSQGPLAGS